MTQEKPTLETVLEKIRSRGHWKVIVRPERFERERIVLSDCIKTVEECKVMLRGWDYPHVSNREPPYVGGVDYSESLTDWDGYKELWRMYQSGQFVHFFGCREDWLGEETTLFGRSRYADTKPGSILEVIMTLYSVTEIYEFAMRMAQKKIFDDTILLSITLNGMKDRKLTFLEAGRHLFEDYVSKIPVVEKERNVTVEDLLGKGHEMALDHTVWILERFNWTHPPRSMLKEEQEKLLTGRF
jgi:hypothetical protein